MNIQLLVWDRQNIEHIARHNVEKEEIEELLGRFHQTRKVWKGRYSMRGQTESGRYLIVFFDTLGHGRAYAVTAREMTDDEKKHYRGSL